MSFLDHFTLQLVSVNTPPVRALDIFNILLVKLKT